jgi:hypothetical protein
MLVARAAKLPRHLGARLASTTSDKFKIVVIGGGALIGDTDVPTIFLVTQTIRIWWSVGREPNIRPLQDRWKAPEPSATQSSS